jgi:hypothetical protein
VPARIGAPGLGELGGGYPLAGDWSVSFGWRYQKSDRHYIGDVYQEQRDQLGNQVINHINVADVTFKYQVTRRVEFSVGIPYSMDTRSQTIATTPDLTRYQTGATGLGDILMGVRRWMFDPDTHSVGNVQLGAGVQFPTGADNVQDTFLTLTNGVIGTQIRNVDQSIQPGEGGWGFLGEVMAFRSVKKTNLYLDAAYLLTPQENNGVTNGTATSGPSQYMSVYDQFFMEGGDGFRIKGPVSGGAAIRVEGVPAHDLVGGQFGFRRPGVAVSFQPSVSLRNGKNLIEVGVPIAIYRNRFQSAADELTGAHGDAAFANWLLMVNVSRKF